MHAKGGSKGRVDVGVVVNAVPEGGATGETDGVGTWENDQVLKGEAMGLEVGEKGREV